MSTRLTVSVVLITLGALFLLDNLGVLDAGAAISQGWPLVLVVLGGLLAVEQRRVGVGPLLLAGVGIVLLAATMDAVPLGFDIVWPVALVGVGLWLLLRRSMVSGGGRTADSRIEAVAFFGDRYVRSSSRQFEIAGITSLFGDVEVDLRDAQPAEDAAAVDLTVLFGDVEVLVPAGCKVVVSASSLFGDISQGGARDAPAEEASVLQVRGLAVFGDVKIRQ